MRVVLVGSPTDRERLRRLLTSGVQVVGEAGTLEAARALDAGADAFVLADNDNHDEPTDIPSSVESLTTRELEVLRLLAEGLPNKMIAARLGISDQTVKFHIASICGKLGAANRTQAVRVAVRRGLVSL